MSFQLRLNLKLALAYALVGVLMLQFAIPPGYVTPLFPSAGIALFGVWRYGLHSLPGIFAGATVVHAAAMLRSDSEQLVWAFILIAAAGAVVQAVAGYYLIRKILGQHNPLRDQKSVLRFVFLVAPIAGLFSPMLGVGLLLLQGIVPAQTLVFTAINWWTGDFLGILIATPLLLVFLGRPAEAWRKRRLSVALPLGFALLILMLVFYVARGWEHDRLQRNLERDAQQISHLLSKRLDTQLDLMLALERLASVHPRLTQQVWRTFALPLLERHPGTQNFGWSPLVQDSARASFEAQAAAESGRAFRILGRDEVGRITYTLAQRPEYLPILYVEPRENNLSVVGLDILVHSGTGQAARRSQRERRAIATAPFNLLQDAGAQRSIVVYQAVFRDDQVQSLGVVSGVFRMGDAINAVLDGRLPSGLLLCVSDQGDSMPQRLYGPADCASPGWQAKTLRWQDELDFAGRQWRLQIVATPGYLFSLHDWGGWLILWVAAFCTSLLVVFVLLMSARALRVEHLVDARTRQLAAAGRRMALQQEELNQAQRISLMGSWEMPPGGQMCHCSQGLCELMHLGSPSVLPFSSLLERLAEEDRTALECARAELLQAPGLLTLDARMDYGGVASTVLHFRLESTLADDGETLRLRGTAQDVTAARAAEEHIAFLAHYDVLTGLPNRAQWNERIQRELRKASRGQGKLAVLFLDLDHFKSINDTLGHQVGDHLLATVARLLREGLRESDFFARLGGDEFVVLLVDLERTEDAAIVARKLIELLRAPLMIDGHELMVSTSVGIAIYPEDGRDASTLLKHADTAMYSAKSQGRNTYCYFRADMDVLALEHLMLRNALHRALEREELRLHYQPQIAAADGRVLGCEALVRWQHPELGLLPPVQFIPLAEENGLIVPLGNWVLRTACRQLACWQERGWELTIAVNISALQFAQPDFVEQVAQALRESGAQAHALELELTESALMQPNDALLTRMRALGEMGILLALDDFGTGYSSLSYLKRLPIRRLKLDRAFVQELPHNTEDAAIATATLSMARELGMDVVAEGVETVEQKGFLAERGCQVMQGYLYSTPLPVDDFERWLLSRQE